MKSNLYQLINYLIASVWLVNGLFCKIVNLVPRHEEIVAAILGQNFSRELIIFIGISEIFVCIWVLFQLKTRLSAIFQISLVLLMNTLEFILTPHLLLWGRFNALFAVAFALIIYVNEFHLKKRFDV